jgi:transcriptional regulator with XRE-family HTH domain
LNQNARPRGFSISDAMIDFRIKENMSQQELAFNLNISQAAVSHYEDFKRYPKHNILKKICYFIGVPIPEIDEKRVLKSIVLKLRRLSNTQLLSVLDFVNKSFGDIVNDENDDDFEITKFRREGKNNGK